MAIDFSKAFDTVPTPNCSRRSSPPHSAPTSSAGCPATSKAGRPDAATMAPYPPSDPSTLVSPRDLSSPLPSLTTMYPIIPTQPPSSPHMQTTSRQQHLPWTSPLLRAILSAHSSDVASWAHWKGLDSLHPQITQHTFHPPYSPVPNRPTRHLGGIRPHIVSDPKNPGGHLSTPITPFHLT